MNTLLLLSSVLALLLAALGLWRPFEPVIRRIYPWAPFSTLLLAVAADPSHTGLTSYPNLLLDMQIGLDSPGRAFLVLTSFLWLGAGLYSLHYFKGREEERFFRFYFLSAFSGTSLLAMAQDAPTFYAGYAVMTLAGYGLVNHARTAAALLAGRVYIVVAITGEMLTLAGLIIAASGTGSFSLAAIAEGVRQAPAGGWSFWLIFLGFGTKVGLVPLHFWLPRAYFWAPLPAVAVLSGAMTKAGILGWLRFLPSYESSRASLIVIGAGALMAFYGVLVGLLQTRAKTTLAFSSLSQMGYLTMALGAALEPGAPLSSSLAALTGFAYHHGLNKAVLFLGLGILASAPLRSPARALAFAVMGFCALSLVGVPFTSGAYAKALLKNSGGESWHTLAGPVLALGSVGTGLLLARLFLLCLRREQEQVSPSRAWLPWITLSLPAFGGHWLLPESLAFFGLAPEATLDQGPPFLPLAIGLPLALLLTAKLWLSHSRFTPRPFDLLLQGIYKAAAEDWPRLTERFIRGTTLRLERARSRLKPLKKAEALIEWSQHLYTSWSLGCGLFLLVGILLWASLYWGEYL